MVALWSGSDNAPHCMQILCSYTYPVRVPAALAPGAGRLWGWQAGRSCAFRDQRTQLPSPPGQVLVTWDTAPVCKGKPWGSNAVRGADGQLWGYENGASCAFRKAATTQATMWASAPPCMGIYSYYKPVKDAMGRLWGWENGQSCRL